MDGRHTGAAAAIITIVAAVSAAGPVREVDDFSADATETFDWFDGKSVGHAVPIFGGWAKMSPADAETRIFSSVARPDDDIPRTENASVWVGVEDGGVAFDFSTDVRAFAVRVASEDDETIQVRFFDAAGRRIDQGRIRPHKDAWVWQSWESDEAVRRVEIWAEDIFAIDTVRVAGSVVPTPGGMAAVAAGIGVAVFRRR